MDQVRIFQALKYESCPVSAPGKSLQRSRERLKTDSGDSRRKGRFLSDHHDTMMIIDDLSRVPWSGSTNKAFAPLKTGAAIWVDRAASQLLTQRLSRTSASWSSWASARQLYTEWCTPDRCSDGIRKPKNKGLSSQVCRMHGRT